MASPREREREREREMHTTRIQKAESLSDYAQQDLSVMTQGPQTRHAKASKEIRTQAY
jgi:hypothetical protein